MRYSNLGSKANEWFSAYVGGNFVIPTGVSEVIITVAIDGNPEILLQAHWVHCIHNWWGENVKGFRMIGKSDINGQEYGAIVSYNNNTRDLNLQRAWVATTDVTASSTITYVYR